MKIVYIIHGYMASVNDHWFQWLKKELEKRNISVFVLSMPHSDNPSKEEWINHLQKNIITGSNTFIVAHSLGCIATLLFLNKTNAKIGGMICVSGFDHQLKEIPELDNFIGDQIDYEKLVKNISQRIVIASPQDYIVPFSYSENLSEQLQSKLISIPDSGHFMKDDGYEKFPQLLNEIKKIID